MKKTVFLTAVLSSMLLCGGTAIGAGIIETGPNDTFDNPMMLEPIDFSIILHEDIIHSDSIPWTSIRATGNKTFDFFSFIISENEVDGYFDIDHAFRSNYDFVNHVPFKDPIDLVLHLFDSQGNYLSEGDVSPMSSGAGGSLSDLDPFMEYTFTSPGEYVLGVGRYGSMPSPTEPGVLLGEMPRYNDSYTLQISLSDVDDHCQVIPLPPSLWLLGSAAATLIGFGRRKQMQ